MTGRSEYLSSLILNQETIQKGLDVLLDEYETIPVGWGYIDIIILRERFVDFIKALTEMNLVIECVTWWCHATEENKKKLGCPHGYGGPMTKFGWFSEMCHDYDELYEDAVENLDSEYSRENIKRINEMAAAIIKDKQTVTYADGSYLIFQRDICLTPGFYIRVPDDWRNKHTINRGNVPS